MSTSHPQENFHIGDDWDFTATLTNPDGSAMNLTGASITWKLESLDFSKTFFTLNVGSGITVTNAAGGIVAYGLTAAQTATLVPGTYYDLLRVVLSAGPAFTMLEGVINAAPQPA